MGGEDGGAMTKTDWIVGQFRELNVWRRREERAPHKPLLVLLALGRVQRGEARLARYEEIDGPLTRLLEEFGPPRKSVHPELPFYHLQTDGVWEVEEKPELRRREGSRNFLKSDLMRLGIAGGFPEGLFEELKARPEAVRAVGRELLEAHFPESLHEAIAAAAGLDLAGITRGARRDPAFREEVLAAWGRQCAFCGYAVQLDRADLGLEAAHVRWVQAGGPDSIGNGLACCSLHHLAFDRGAMTISEDLRIVVSSRVHGSGRAEEMFYALHGQGLRRPSRRAGYPRAEFLEWHRRQVFQGVGRD